MKVDLLRRARLSMLRLENLDVFYDSIQALRNLSFEVKEGEIFVLLGANGAGKTTTLKAISGLLVPRRGRVIFQGRDITNSPVQERVRMGISLVPEGRRVFSELTVEENLLLGGYLKNAKEREENLKKVFSLFPVLKERRKQLAGTLSGGEQQMLSIGRALMSNAKLLLLDEPSLGLAPIVMREIFQHIKEINQEGTTILLVEQNAHLALQIAHRAGLLRQGELVLQGPVEELKEMEVIKAVYLGG